MTALAEKAGVGIATISRAEAGRPVSVETLRRLAAALKQHPPLPELRSLIDPEVA